MHSPPVELTHYQSPPKHSFNILIEMLKTAIVIIVQVMLFLFILVSEFL